MEEIIGFFLLRCNDKSTLQELYEMVDQDFRWPQAHDLFTRIRMKNLNIDQDNEILGAQYNFEEICAKTLYNLSHPPAPFDPDSPFFVIPNAIALARYFNVSDLSDICSDLSILKK